MNKKNHLSKNIILFCSIIISLFSLTGCSKAKNPITKTAVCFDTIISITIYDNNTDILDECLKKCQDYEMLFSPTIPTSDISLINNSNGNIIKINPNTIKLIEDSLKYSELTNGKYDISIYPAVKLWDFHNKDNPLPKQEDIGEAIKNINYKNITINSNDNTLKLNSPESQIDLGSIAKGFIADEIAKYLTDNGIKSAIINLGGDIKLVGDKNGVPYTIGIQDPNNKDNIIATVLISNTSIATSGTYERFIENNGKIYHHIIDPSTGYPADTDINSVTIITPSAKEADALCTSAILLGKDNAISLLNSIKNVDYIIITNDNNRYESENIKNILK